MYTEICRATTKKEKKKLYEEIHLKKKKQKTNDRMSDLSPNISSVNVT